MVVNDWTSDEIVALGMIIGSIIGLAYGLWAVIREGSKQ